MSKWNTQRKTQPSRDNPLDPQKMPKSTPRDVIAKDGSQTHTRLPKPIPGDTITRGG